jgi:hypothetical protein
MPNVIHVTVKNRRMVKTVAALKGLGNLPAMTSDGMMDWGKTLERDMKSAARQAKIEDFTGTLLKGRGIKWRQEPKGYTGNLFMRSYAIKLDSMKAHWVNIRRSRSAFLRWARQARDPRIRTAAQRINDGTENKHAIQVRKHPFIRMGFERARPKLALILREKAKLAMSGG